MANSAGLQVKSIRQLAAAPIPVGSITTDVGQYIDDDKARSLSNDLTAFNVLSDAGKLSIEVSNGEQSFKIALSTYINPIVSSLVYLRNRQSGYLTEVAAASTYVPWNLSNATGKKITNGTLVLAGPSETGNNTALSIEVGKAFVINSAFEVAASKDVNILQNCKVFNQLEVVDTLTAAPNCLSANNISATNISTIKLTANNLCAGYHNSLYLISAVSENEYVASRSILVNGDISAENISAQTNISASNITASNISASNNLSGSNISTVTISAQDSMTASNIYATNVSCTRISAWDLTAGIAIDTTSNRPSFATIIDSAKLSATKTVANESEIMALSAGLKTTNGTTTVNLKVVEDQTINIVALSSKNLTAGNNLLAISYNDTMINVEGLSAHALKAGGYVGTPNLNVQADALNANPLATIQINDLSAKHLTAVGSSENDQIAHLTAKAACWS